MRMYIALELVNDPQELRHCLKETIHICKLDDLDFSMVVNCASDALDKKLWGIVADLDIQLNEESNTRVYNLVGISLAESATDEGSRALH